MHDLYLNTLLHLLYCIFYTVSRHDIVHIEPSQTASLTRPRSALRQWQKWSPHRQKAAQVESLRGAPTIARSVGFERWQRVSGAASTCMRARCCVRAAWRPSLTRVPLLTTPSTPCRPRRRASTRPSSAPAASSTPASGAPTGVTVRATEPPAASSACLGTCARARSLRPAETQRSQHRRLVHIPSTTTPQRTRTCARTPLSARRPRHARVRKR